MLQPYNNRCRGVRDATHPNTAVEEPAPAEQRQPYQPWSGAWSITNPLAVRDPSGG
jgi:hypothetical protein